MTSSTHAHQHGQAANPGKPVIGLMGAPGSGKSAVARAMARHGGVVVDADQIARDALAAPAVRDQLVSWWGSGVLDPATRRIDRQAVAGIVFEDPDAKKQLEGLIHPLVRKMRALLHENANRDAAYRFIIEDVPLLMETGLDVSCDAAVFVHADLAARQARVAETRGWSIDELARRESAQLPLDSKRARADYLVQNDGSMADLEKAADRVLDQILERFSGPDDQPQP